MLRCNHVLLSKCFGLWKSLQQMCVWSSNLLGVADDTFSSTQSGWKVAGCREMGTVSCWIQHQQMGKFTGKKGELAHQQLWFYAVKKNADCQQTSSTKNMIDWEIWYSTTGNPSFGLKFRTFDSRGMKMSTTNERNPWNFILKKLCLVFVLESSHWFIHWLHPFQYYAYNYIYTYIHNM